MGVTSRVGKKCFKKKKTHLPSGEGLLLFLAMDSTIYFVFYVTTRFQMQCGRCERARFNCTYNLTSVFVYCCRFFLF